MTSKLEKCNFSSFGNCTCSFALSKVDSFSYEEQSIFLTHCGIIPVSDCDFYQNICSNHEKSFHMSYKKRLESRRCCAPAVISCHHGNNCKVERHLSALQVTSVFEKTGIVLPVGIGLCAQCRKNMLKNRSPDVSHETHHSVQNIDATDSTGEGPSIKRRRLQSQSKRRGIYSGTCPSH